MAGHKFENLNHVDFELIREFLDKKGHSKAFDNLKNLQKKFAEENQILFRILTTGL